MCARMLETANTFACEGSDEYDEATLGKISEAFVQRQLSLTQDSIDALRLSLRELIQTYGARASIERATHPPEKLITIGWSYVLTPFDGRYPISEIV